MKVGGDIYNGTESFLTQGYVGAGIPIGKSVRTADRRTPIVVNGVLADGQQNSNNPTKNTIAVVPYFLNAYYTTLPDIEFIQHNVNWLRLRDITLSYKLPQSVLHRVKALKSASVFMTGNDLILITNYQGADPAVNATNPGTNGVGAYGFDFGSPATPLSLSVGLKAFF
jgi:hypothetical protein